VASTPEQLLETLAQIETPPKGELSSRKLESYAPHGHAWQSGKLKRIPQLIKRILKQLTLLSGWHDA